MTLNCRPGRALNVWNLFFSNQLGVFCRIAIIASFIQGIYLCLGITWPAFSTVAVELGMMYTVEEVYGVTMYQWRGKYSWTVGDFSCIAVPLWLLGSRANHGRKLAAKGGQSWMMTDPQMARPPVIRRAGLLFPIASTSLHSEAHSKLFHVSLSSLVACL